MNITYSIWKIKYMNLGLFSGICVTMSNSHLAIFFITVGTNFTCTFIRSSASTEYVIKEHCLSMLCCHSRNWCWRAAFTINCWLSKSSFSSFSQWVTSVIFHWLHFSTLFLCVVFCLINDQELESCLKVCYASFWLTLWRRATHIWVVPHS
jgi:hypothetical protein